MKNTGDGFLLEFPSVVGAIESAIAMQALMAERNNHLPADRVMQFRLGVHMGDVIADEDEVFGDGVNIAVRLEAVAAPGGVAVSAKAYHEASKHLSVRPGRRRQSPFQEHRRADRGLDLGAGRAATTRAASQGTSSNLPAQYRTAIVGVLPFANLSDSADEYFSDGLTEDLIHALSLQSFYRVLSRNSTFSFKGKSLSTRLIAREIDATYLIQGSVRRAGTKIRVTAELIAPESGEQLWTGRYDRDIGDLFAMQDEITTQSVGGDWRRRSFAPRRPPPARSSSADLTAWDRFLRGLSHYYRQTKADFETSIGLFREAIALDPDALDRARLSRHHPGAGRAVWLDQEHARIVDRGDEPGGKQRPARSAFVIRVCDPVLHACDAGPSRRGDGGGESARSSSTRTTWARAACLEYATS